MPKRIVPNGSEIKARRKAMGLPQKTFAASVGIKERTIRYIEDENATVLPEKLNTIASALNTLPENLILSAQSRGGEKSDVKQAQNIDNVFELRRTTSASTLLQRIFPWNEIDFAVRADIKTAGAGIIEELLTILHEMTGAPFHQPGGPMKLEGWKIDPYKRINAEAHQRRISSTHPYFGDLHQQARLQELIEELQNRGLFVFVGAYWYRRWSDEETDVSHSQVVRISFSTSEETSVTETYAPGVIYDKEKDKWINPDEVPF